MVQIKARPVGSVKFTIMLCVRFSSRMVSLARRAIPCFVGTLILTGTGLEDAARKGCEEVLFWSWYLVSDTYSKGIVNIASSHGFLDCGHFIPEPTGIKDHHLGHFVVVSLLRAGVWSLASPSQCRRLAA